MDRTANSIKKHQTVHGDFTENANYSQAFKHVVRTAEHSRVSHGRSGLTNPMREALEMIAVKMGRILAGEPYHLDHWEDIEGYARLVSDRLRANGAGQPAEPEPLPDLDEMRSALASAVEEEQMAVSLDRTRD